MLIRAEPGAGANGHPAGTTFTGETSTGATFTGATSSGATSTGATSTDATSTDATSTDTASSGTASSGSGSPRPARAGSSGGATALPPSSGWTAIGPNCASSRLTTDRATPYRAAIQACERPSPARAQRRTWATCRSPSLGGRPRRRTNPAEPCRRARPRNIDT